MTQGFDEWYRDARDITAKAGWDAGQQSRQAEIDELQKRIDDAACYLENLPMLYQTQNYVDAMRILKGKEDE